MPSVVAADARSKEFENHMHHIKRTRFVHLLTTRSCLILSDRGHRRKLHACTQKASSKARSPSICMKLPNTSPNPCRREALAEAANRLPIYRSTLFGLPRVNKAIENSAPHFIAFKQQAGTKARTCRRNEQTNPSVLRMLPPAIKRPSRVLVRWKYPKSCQVCIDGGDLKIEVDVLTKHWCMIGV